MFNSLRNDSEQLLALKKQPLKRIEIPIRKFNNVAVPHLVDLLRQHKSNIEKVEHSCSDHEYASKTSLSKTVEYFLNGFGDACGEHVKLRDFAGRTALHHFAGCEQFGVRIVRMLVGAVPEAGRAGFVDAADNDGNTAVRLMRSKEGGQDAVEFLVKAGGQVPQ